MRVNHISSRNTNRQVWVGRKSLITLIFAALVLSRLVCTAAESEKPQLPTFQEGQWKGCNAVVETRNYRALLKADGRLQVQPLANSGENLGQPILFGNVHCWYNPKGKRHQGRPITEFTNPPSPSMNPHVIKLAGKLKDDVAFELEFTFTANSITAAGGAEDPRGILNPTVFRMSTSWAKSHNIPNDMEQPQREKMLDGLQVKTKEEVDGRSKRFTYPYANSMKFAGAIEDLEVVGTYAPRIISLAPGRNNDNKLRGYIYSGNCPWQGFGAYLQASSKKIDLRKQQIVLEIK